MNKIKVGIIEDSEVHVAWIATELMDEQDFEIVSQDALGRKGIASVKLHQPDIVILDFQLHDMTGLEVAKWIKTQDQNIKIFMLTAHTEISILERIISDKNIDAIAIKGSYYLEENFLLAMKHIADGGTYLDPSLLKKLRDSKNMSGLNTLTRREFEIFIQVNTGKSDVQIANDLCVELSHVKNLKSKISKKTQGQDIADLLSNLMENANTLTE
ncbi:MAG TPA: response regulator transcription factor [Gammaproteobacteria bacterium]|nr:response regulator transcription factor [Gammaproteobacteria bacterium]